MMLSITASASPATQDNQSAGYCLKRAMNALVKEVRHELVMLPYYGVFDNLSYKVDPDGTVTLFGQVARPTLKSDAENVVKHIEGVEKVVNNIEVLPTSINDDHMRRDAYRAIFRNSVLSQYRCGPSLLFTSSSTMDTSPSKAWSPAPWINRSQACRPTAFPEYSP